MSIPEPPVIISLTGGAILFPLLPLSNRSEIYTYIAFILCIFVMASMLIEFFKGTMARRGLHGETTMNALRSLIWNNKRRYGGYTVHIGVVMIYAGIAASSSYGTHIEKRVKIGDTIEIKNYMLRYEKLAAVQATSVKTRIIAQLAVEKNGGKILMPKTAHADENGFFALFLDTEGNRLGLNSSN